MSRASQNSPFCQIENSIEGAISTTLDLLIHETDLKIRAEIVIPVRLFLIGLPGSTMSEIKTVTSHSNPLGQSRQFLERTLPGVTQVAAMSTAAAVQEVVDGGDPSRAAIGARRTAVDQIGGVILAADIQDVVTNVTRFVVISYGEAARTGDDETSIASPSQRTCPVRCTVRSGQSPETRASVDETGEPSLQDPFG